MTSSRERPGGKHDYVFTAHGASLLECQLQGTFVPLADVALRLRGRLADYAEGADKSDVRKALRARSGHAGRSRGLAAGRTLL